MTIGGLYLLSMSSAMATALIQAPRIRRNKPIHHGWWLTALLFLAGLITGFVVRGGFWPLLAGVGMAGVWSSVFRSSLNALRHLPQGYMGPPPGDTSNSRSQYDLLMWRIAARLKWQPASVAQGIELGASAVVGILFIIYYR